MVYKNMINPKKKGNRGENLFAQWLRENGFKAYRDSASGGGNSEKGDIVNGLNCHFEVKTVKAINLKKVWKKAEADAIRTQNTPYIVIHFDGMGENEWLMVMNNYDWLEMFKKSQGDKIVVEVPQKDSRNKKYKIQNLLRATKEVLKEYE